MNRYEINSSGGNRPRHIGRPVIANTNDADPRLLAPATVTVEQYHRLGGMPTGNWVDPLPADSLSGVSPWNDETFGPNLRIVP